MRYLTAISLALIVLMALACTSSDAKISATIQAEISATQTAKEWERERGEKFISIVIDHIERGVPIQYMESRLVDGYSSEERLKDLDAAAASGNYDQLEAKYQEDYLWSEDEQCHEWHQGMGNRERYLAQGIGVPVDSYLEVPFFVFHIYGRTLRPSNPF